MPKRSQGKIRNVWCQNEKHSIHDLHGNVTMDTYQKCLRVLELPMKYLHGFNLKILEFLRGRINHNSLSMIEQGR